MWIKIFPDKPIAKTFGGENGQEGAPEYFVAVVKPGRIMFEVAGVSIDIAKEARLAAQKQSKQSLQLQMIMNYG